MARKFNFSPSMLTALSTAFLFFDHTLAEFRIHNVNEIPVNNQLPSITDIIVDFPVLFDTQFFIPKFENTDEIIIITNLIPDRTSPRIPLNVGYSASEDEWTRIADWNIEAGISKARPFIPPHKANNDGDDDRDSDSSDNYSNGINPTGNWMINFTPHSIVATNNGARNGVDGRRKPAYSLMTDIILTDPRGYQRYSKLAQELPCTNLGENGLLCEQLIIEFEDAADGLVSSTASTTGLDKGKFQGTSNPNLQLWLPDTAAAAAAED